MAARTKLEVIKIVQDCAKLYKENLSGKNVLFITTHDDTSMCFETLFMPHNFMHLTSVKSRLNSELFFRAASSNRLSIHDITISPDGTVDLKLDVLPQLMNIHTTARMIGDYDNSKPLLITDKFAGTVTTALGFVNVKDFYMLNTALKKDVREITIQATRRKVIAIFIKNRRDEKYSRLTYIAKGMTIDDNIFDEALSEKVDFLNLSATFKIPKNKPDAE